MIPTRNEIQVKISEYYGLPEPRPLIQSYISEWLDDLSLPATITIASNEVSPKAQILDDLESYIHASEPS